MDRRVKATILYATETGRSKSYANVVKNLFDRAFACKVCIHMQTLYMHFVHTKNMSSPTESHAHNTVHAPMLTSACLILYLWVFHHE